MTILKQSLELNAISSKRFTYTKLTFVAELSDFNDNPSVLHQRIYDDACDEGFAIRSENTGTVKVFRFKQVVRTKNSDNEMMFIEYEPTDVKLRKAGLIVRIYND